MKDYADYLLDMELGGGEVYWESIDESLYYEAGEKEIVQVSKDKPYLDDMILQNVRVMIYLNATYPERKFKRKMNSHEFGQYEEIMEEITSLDD